MSLSVQVSLLLDQCFIYDSDHRLNVILTLQVILFVKAMQSNNNIWQIYIVKQSDHRIIRLI